MSIEAIHCARCEGQFGKLHKPGQSLESLEKVRDWKRFDKMQRFGILREMAVEGSNVSLSGFTLHGEGLTMR
jgi:hypothetical protein